MLIAILDEGNIRLAMRGCRLSFASVDKLDSSIIRFGKDDYALAKKLIRLGNDHSKFLRCINVTLLVNAPLYFHKQLDTYKVGTTTLSESTMHTLHKLTAFTQDNFETVVPTVVINTLNELLYSYKRTKDKSIWHQLIGLLPSSFLQERMLFCNYQVLRTIYQQRHGHKLPEWQYFCNEVEKQLSYGELLTIA